MDVDMVKDEKKEVVRLDVEHIQMDVNMVKDQKKETVRLDGIHNQKNVDMVKDPKKDIYEDLSDPDPEPSPEKIFRSAIRFGADGIFVDMINDGFTSSTLNHPQDFLLAVCESQGSVRCASALIKGETRLAVDVRSPLLKTGFPLHVAASLGSPDITELLLVNNAHTDVRYPDHECFTLPLHKSLRSSKLMNLKEWTPPENSINQLLFSLCLPCKQDALENVGLLAWTTKHTEEEFLRYVKGGHVVEVAALVIVAWKKLCDHAMTARSMLTQSEVRVSRDRKTAMLQLFDIFESAGEDLESYVKRPKLFVSSSRAITAVKYLLQQKGIHVKQEETDLSYLHRTGYSEYYFPPKDIFEHGLRLPEDLFMEHYGKSGYRWTSNLTLHKIGQKIDTYLSHSPPKTQSTTNSSTIDQATLSSIFASAMHFEVLNKMNGWRFNFSNVISSTPWASFASVMKLFK